MTTIYIDPTRGTNGTGTFADPRNTWTGVTWTAGTTYLQRANTTFTSAGLNGISVTTGGSSGSRITIGSYDPNTGLQTTEKARLVGGTRFGINLQSGVGFVTIQDFDISGVGDGTNINFGITWTAASDSTDLSVYVNRCDVHDLVSGASADCSGISTRGANNVISDCRFWNIPTDAIFGRGQNWTVERNRVWNINTDGRNQADCFQLGGVSADGAGLVIQDNYFDGSNGTGKQVIIIQSIGSNHTIRRNVLIGATDGQQCVYSDAPTTIEQNIMIDGIHGARVAGGASTIRANVFVNNLTLDQVYKMVWLESDGHTVVNNTFIDNKTQTENHSGIYCEADDVGHTIRNNIFVGLYWGIRLSGTLMQEETNNVYFNCFNNIVDDGVSRNINATSLVVDPRLDPRYKPTNLILASSGFGVTGTDYYGETFRGNTIGAVNMGYNGLQSIFKSTEAKGNSEDFHGKKRSR